MGNIIICALSKIRVQGLRYALVALWFLALLILMACSFSSSTVATSTPTTIISAQDEADESSIPAFNVQPESTPDALFQTMPLYGPTQAVESLAILNQEYAAYGSITIEGMAAPDYDSAMSLEWQNVHTFGDPVAYDIDLTEVIDVDTLEQYILNLGRYDGVDISIIGQSELGRNIYMVTVDLGGSTSDKPLIMLSGGVHAREFAGPEYLVKCLNDTLAKAQTDVYTRSLLERVTIVAVPLVNPDGRELIMEGGASRRKSNANGVDLNRALPSVNAGQLAAGVRLAHNYSDEPSLEFFAGYSLGSESETQAMIKWFNTYVPKASVYIDLHQQGGISYYNKPFATSSSNAACLAFAEAMNALLGNGYYPKAEAEDYALDGDGGTMTDYARSVSEGYVYSYRLGRMALLVDGAEIPLICFGDIDSCLEYYAPANANFLCMTFEIGRNRTYLGPGKNRAAKTGGRI